VDCVVLDLVMPDLADHGFKQAALNGIVVDDENGGHRIL